MKEKEIIYKIVDFSLSCYDRTSAHIFMHSWEIGKNDVQLIISISISSSKELMKHCYHHSAIIHHLKNRLHHIWALFCISWLIDLGQEMVMSYYGDMNYLCSIISCTYITADIQYRKSTFHKIIKDLLILSWLIFHSYILIYLLVESNINYSMIQTAQLLQF